VPADIAPIPALSEAEESTGGLAWPAARGVRAFSFPYIESMMVMNGGQVLCVGVLTLIAGPSRDGGL